MPTNEPTNERAVRQAEEMARLFRRRGYKEAEAAPQYCIDEIGMDNFYTYTVSVYVGKKKNG